VLTIWATSYDFTNTNLTQINNIQLGQPVQNVTGSGGADNFTLFNFAGGGATINGGGGNDTINFSGSTERCTILGGEGTDIIQGGGLDDTLNLGAFVAASSIESIDGGNGFNQIVLTIWNTSYDFTTTTITLINNIQLNASGQTVIGSAGADTITGSANADNISGGAGNDSIRADAGADVINGGIGNDTIVGGAGNDSMTGGLGVDTFVWTATGDAANSTTTDHVMDFMSGIDKLDFTAIAATPQWLGTAAFNNTIPGTAQVRYYQTGGNTFVELDSDGNGSSNMVVRLDGLVNVTANDIIGIGNLTVNGTTVADTLTGGSGNDSISGLAGNDSITANNGNDTIVGGSGADSLWGGAGNDMFVYTVVGDSGIGPGNYDVINDFATGDTIDLQQFTGEATFQTGGLGAADLVGGVFQVAYETSGGNTTVFVDENGDNTVDFQIQLLGITSLSSSDFAL
jgi:Ca2+-binding RTX toxin-like protein